MARSEYLDPVVAEYALAHTSPPDAVQHSLQRVTREKTGRWSGMQIGQDQAVFMEVLARAMGVRTAIEIGTFTGYSALAVARGLAPGGKLYCLDVSDEWTSIGREHWALAGVDGRIDLRIGPALETLAALDDGIVFDLAFVDADKPNYQNYFEALLPRVRDGGLILFDNTLWSGRVARPEEVDEDTLAFRALNDALVVDERVQVTQLTVGDGVTVVQKR